MEPGAGEINVQSRYAQEQAPTQVPNYDKFVNKQTTLWPSLTMRRTNVHLDSCSFATAQVPLPGDHCM